MFVWASSMGAVVVTGVRGHAAIKMLDSLFPHKVNLGKQFLFDLWALPSASFCYASAFS